MSITDTDDRDILTDGHKEFMRSYCAWEERKSKAMRERFLAGKLSQNKARPAQLKSF
jgi:hypothetical protein